MAGDLTTEKKIDLMYADWFGIGENKGLRHMLIETRNRSMENETKLKTMWTVVRVIMFLGAATPSALAILGWLVGAITVNPPG